MEEKQTGNRRLYGVTASIVSHGWSYIVAEYLKHKVEEIADYCCDTVKCDITVGKNNHILRVVSTDAMAIGEIKGTLELFGIECKMEEVRLGLPIDVKEETTVTRYFHEGVEVYSSIEKLSPLLSENKK